LGNTGRVGVSLEMMPSLVILHLEEKRCLPSSCH